jgi:flagellar L-ring protein precursor FlgH
MKLLRLITLTVVMATAHALRAQDGSLFLRPAQTPNGPTLENSSFMFQQLPPESIPRQLKEHDIITIIVDYRSRFLSEGNGQARKTQNIQAILQEWVRLDNGDLKPALMNDGEPGIAAQNNSQNRSQSDLELRDTMSFRIAAEIVDIQPNGNLVIEAHQTLRNNEERWRISLTGIVRRESIQPDRTVSSDAIYDLNIDKEEIGQVRDGYARGWLLKWYDKYKPF